MRDVLIRRDPSAARLTRPRNLVAQSGRTTGGFLSAAPAEVSLESDCLIELRVRARDEGHAAEVAQERLIRPLTAALSLVCGGFAHVELARVAVESEIGQVVDEGWSVWSDSGLMHNVGAMPRMAEDEARWLSDILGVLRNDTVAKNAAADFVEGDRLAWTSGGRSTEVGAAVLRYFQVIERIATRMGASRKQETGEEDAKSAIVNDLARHLRGHGTVHAKIGKVRNATRSLDELGGMRLATDIEHACGQLALASDKRIAALGLNRLRNQSLAHPGKGLTRERLAASQSQARGASYAFLDGYTRWRRQES